MCGFVFWLDIVITRNSSCNQFLCLFLAPCVCKRHLDENLPAEFTTCMQNLDSYCYTHTHIHPFNGLLSGTTRVSRYQKGKTSLDFTEARDSEWQWHQLGHMQVCTSLQADNHASTHRSVFLQAGCPSCRPTNSVKALKALKA